MEDLDQFWAYKSDEVIEKLDSRKEGLNSEEAENRLFQLGENKFEETKKESALTIFINQFRSPIIILLLATAVISYFVGSKQDFYIITIIILISNTIGWYQEKTASDALNELIKLISVKITVKRDGKREEIPLEHVVPGDIVILSSGDIVSGDARLISSNNLLVDEAVLTGEAYPVEKQTKPISKDATVNSRTNTLFMGTHILSGSGEAVIVRTGLNTEFGKISAKLRLKPMETDFDRGIARFGHILMEVTFIMVVVIFAINVYLKKSVFDSFLFSLALAIGLTPQLLPVIISVNLAKGTKLMAEKKVIVKHPRIIENFGSMNVFCTDKTGTITMGTVKLKTACGLNDRPSEKAELFAFMNSHFQDGYENPIDEAITEALHPDISKFTKLDELPYDFTRRRVSVLVKENNSNLIISKGAMKDMLAISSQIELEDGTIRNISDYRDQILETFNGYSSNGFRTLALGYRKTDKTEIQNSDEIDLIFLGFLLFEDPIKPDIVQTIQKLTDLGVSTKIITGDNHVVSRYVANQLGIAEPNIVTGAELRELSTPALIARVNSVDIFAEMDPNQKERIIRTLKQAGNVVGYMGDGINDAPSLHTADVGISVDNASGVAKQAAEIILLDKSLETLVDGIKQGRKTFANTMKYLFITISANFGNMFSMAGISLLLSFLPLLPTQILLINLFTDTPVLGISTDKVDKDMIQKPLKWDMKFIFTFMVVFGTASSIFDYMTYLILEFGYKAKPEEFQTGWFVVSILSELTVLFIIRTKRRFYKSKPSSFMLYSSIIIAILLVLILYIPGLNSFFGLMALNFWLLMILFGIVVLYCIGTEAVKKDFFLKFNY